MKNEVTRLFDIPYFLQSRFGDEHPVFINYYANGFKEIKSRDYVRESDVLCSYLITIGIQKGDRIISVIGNSPEYSIAEMGILGAGGIHVPLSPLSNSESLEKNFNLIKPRVILTAAEGTYKRIQAISSKLSFLSQVIDISSLPERDGETDNTLCSLRRQTISADDTAVILFTSGSTGQSKGVMLSHNNILASAREFSGADVFAGCKRSLSFLPLSQSAERKMSYACQLNGISICYPQASRDMLYNIDLFKPGITALVPFLLNELYEQIKHSSQKYTLKIFCGGAAVPASLINLISSFGVRIFEVYGLTETSSLFAFNTIQDNRTGTVGKIAKSVSTSFSDTGEILVRGDNIMKGYMDENFLPADAKDAKGWFHTGDVGSIDSDGFLTITGRIKSAFKNSRGIYINPEVIEQELLRDPIFRHITITGENEDALTAIIVAMQDQDDENLHSKVNAIIKKWNAHKKDYMKIDRYVILNTTSLLASTLGSLKIDRSNLAQQINSGDKVNFIFV